MYSEDKKEKNSRSRFNSLRDRSVDMLSKGMTPTDIAKVFFDEEMPETMEAIRKYVSKVKYTEFPEKRNLLVKKPKPKVKKVGNILCVGDQHMPFEHPKYLDFIKAVHTRFNCVDVYMMGDIVDNHSISYHEHDPDGLSAGLELEMAIQHLKPWYEAFPYAKVCTGNHDGLSFRKALSNGIPKKFQKDIGEVFEVPNWTFSEEFEEDNIIFTHQAAGNGVQSAYNMALHRHKSVVIGHVHSECYARMINNKDFACIVGCGIDRDRYAFKYAKKFLKDQVISCVVIIDGRMPLVVPMSAFDL